ATLGMAGGLGGIALAYGLLDAIVRQAPPTLPGIDDAAVDGPVLSFAVAVTALAVVFAGLVPAVRIGGIRAT
ncbi:MAG: hypothetical protein GWO00_10685, partial [Gemmatimonadetes bacterium]|nr:hypothetical protein [Actinomycetota bacterium]NIR78819.1 hypothetical protein [Gemmatimonadota bacterium]NIT87447.1 hypothetical protein [Gemmatimonadota bacterium]NIU31311.1 hypothetical protein [Gemmatimonadota bacterium]NIV61662.1 hypothetical protein [Gemmatimonadota bacterium]